MSEILNELELAMLVAIAEATPADANPTSADHSLALVAQARACAQVAAAHHAERPALAGDAA